MTGCGVAVYSVERGEVFECYNDDPRGQAQFLIPSVQDVLTDAELAFEDLSDVVVCCGPGSFTGIRIGLSAAKTFGLVLGVPVWGISSLQALAMTAVEAGLKDEMLVLIETKRKDFYVQSFDALGDALDNAASALGEEIEVRERILIGDAVGRFDPEGVYKRFDVTKIGVGCVARQFVQTPELFSEEVAPVYLRGPDVSQPKNPPRVIADK